MYIIVVIDDATGMSTNDKAEADIDIIVLPGTSQSSSRSLVVLMVFAALTSLESFSF